MPPFDAVLLLQEYGDAGLVRAIGFRDFACADPEAISTGSGFEEKMDTLARPIAGISCF